MTSSQPLLTLEQIGLTRNQKIILKDVDLAIHAGEIISLIGPNGAGKTSLLRIILGLDKPSHGKVQTAKHCRIAYMPQKFEINPHIPILSKDFLRLCSSSFDTQEQNTLFERLDITRTLETPLNKTSGGELQRILLARALLKKPQLLVLDEPTQGVDIHGQAELYEIIEEARNSINCAILMVSHELHVVMAKTDSVVCLNQHICCQGHPEAVSQDPAYISLFGKAHSETLGIYSHHHDHHHDAHGELHSGACSHD